MTAVTGADLGAVTGAALGAGAGAARDVGYRPGVLEAHLRAVRDRGRPALLPYVTGGVTPDWTAHLLACVDAGADALEVGLPFSDPMVDGVTIQEASDRALRRGVTPARVLADLAAVRDRLAVPTVVMTYANLVARPGAAAFCDRLAAAGVDGLIVPDLPLDESAGLEEAAAAAGVALVLLAAPATTPARRMEIARRSRGFVYAVSTMGATGERANLDPAAADVAAGLRAAGDLPVMIGFGISTPAQAVAAARVADGVVIASMLMRRVLAGATPSELGDQVGAVRRALDAPDPPRQELDARTAAQVPDHRRGPDGADRGR